MSAAERIALITGITGQDGTYLSELLLRKGYAVHGVSRRPAIDAGCDPRITVHQGDLSEAGLFEALLRRVQPTEIYNLGGQSQSPLSYELPVYTAEVVGLAPLRVLEAIRRHQDQTGRQVRFFQASSSELFGLPTVSPQSETTPCVPRSPYAIAKLFAQTQGILYREHWGVFAAHGILFNHESPRRGTAFVTRKITRGVARIKYGLQPTLALGNLQARRDWGFAGDFVEAMWRILQQPQPGDFVIATGETHSVGEFVETACAYAGLDWQRCVTVDPRFVRPREEFEIRGDITKARTTLQWQPRVSFPELVHMMVEEDLALVRRELSQQ